jgi:RNA polymerase sigma-70 factor (ECF subfamily)
MFPSEVHDPSEPQHGASARRTLGGLLSSALPELRRWLLRRRGVARLGGESTDDLVQSVCREALDGRDGFVDQGDARFRAWVRTLAERKLADRARHWSTARRESTRRAEDAGLEALESAPDQARSPDAAAAERELAERLLQSIAGLPNDQRAVLDLQVRENLTTRAIAARVGKSEGAVRILRCRALAVIGRELGRAVE